jgi:hypothetical protein
MEQMANGFEKTLRELRQGAALSELTEGLYALVAQVRETGRPGKMIWKLKVKPASRGDGVTLMLEDEVEVKGPPTIRPQTIFFATEDGRLQRNDPRQKELELRAVPAPEVAAGELKKVS